MGFATSEPIVIDDCGKRHVLTVLEDDEAATLERDQQKKRKHDIDKERVGYTETTTHEDLRISLLTCVHRMAQWTDTIPAQKFNKDR